MPLHEAARSARAAAPERGAAPGVPGAPGVRGVAADHDVLVIGTGGAGVAAAIQAAEMGGTVAIAERGTLGGTCVNVGCIPSKRLLEAAAHLHGARAGFPGVAPCATVPDWRAVLDAKNALVLQLRQAKYADVLASYPRITVLGGHARLVERGAESGSERACGFLRVLVGDREHTARRLVIATGTTSAAPPIPGLAEVDALDSTTAMELESLPESLLVLGGGAVGLEMGQIFARVGVRVTVLEAMPRILMGEDEAIGSALAGYLEGEGMQIHTGARVTRVDEVGGEVVARVWQRGQEERVRAARLLVATGRRPRTSDMGLEGAGVRLTAEGYVQVDPTMRTSHPDIYAAGDVTGGPGYVYVAAAGARVAAANAMASLAGTEQDAPRTLDLTAMPRVTFTSPQVGSVGLTEQEARSEGSAVQVATLGMDQVPRALVHGDTRGFVKLVAHAASGRLLGVHALSAAAGELMGEAALALRFGLTARDLAETLHPYLTWGESLKLAAQGFTTDVTRLSCCA